MNATLGQQIKITKLCGNLKVKTQKMKKSTIITISIIILVLMVFKTLYTYIDGVGDEKLSYVHKLNFKFSAKVDSIEVTLKRKHIGNIFFHYVTGTFDESVEDRLKDELEYSGDLQFIFSNATHHAMNFNTKTVDKYQIGDSVVVDTDNNKITLYRGPEVISEDKVTEALAWRPF